MNRRSFFAFLPVAPLALMAEGARAATASQAPPAEAVNLTLMGAAKEKSRNDLMYLSNGPAPLNFPQSDPAKQVAMAVGEDGELWLKGKDKQWKRVVTE